MMPWAGEVEFNHLRDLTARVGQDPLLTQGSTGNSSIKMGGVLCIKASGKWMADAFRSDIFSELNLAEVTECLREGIDPAERFPSASLETAMHAALPHRFVLHVHCVDTIAWAVRNDAPAQLESRLNGLPWQWIPYVASGLPLGSEVERAVSMHPDTQVFVLANHGLVLASDDAGQLESLLTEVRKRLAISPRRAPAPDYAALRQVCASSKWKLPTDENLHALSTDETARIILASGLLYPCQAIFSSAATSGMFRPIGDCGVVVDESARPAELAMLSGLAHVVQRLKAVAPIRYLTEDEIRSVSGEVTYKYVERSNLSAFSAPSGVSSCLKKT